MITVKYEIIGKHQSGIRDERIFTTSSFTAVGEFEGMCTNPFIESVTLLRDGVTVAEYPCKSLNLWDKIKLHVEGMFL